MTIDADALAQRIGARVKQERAALGWSLDRLAAQSGVSRRMLVNVEQGATNPSIATLLRLSDALGIGLPELVDPRRARPRCACVAPASWIRCGAALTAAPPCSRRAPSRRPSSSCGTGPSAPVTSTVSDPHRRGTRELLLVLPGAVVARPWSETGRTCSRPATPPASTATWATPTRNPSRSRGARFALTVFEPDVGSEVPS